MRQRLVRLWRAHKSPWAKRFITNYNVSQYQPLKLITELVRVFSAAGGWGFFGFILKPKKYNSCKSCVPWHSFSDARLILSTISSLK